jgi:hypothetical protein
MPPLNEIVRYLAGSWRMMNGRADGLRAFDISADGFWNSFFAIIVALPALFVGWLAIASELAHEPAVFGSTPSIVARLAFIDIASWVLPLVALGAVARPVGIADRFVPYVIASNWGSALIVLIMLPASLLRLISGEGDFVTLLSLGLFLVTLVFSWRLTNAAIGKGAAVASAVFGGMLVASLLVLFTLQNMLGLTAN